MAEDPAPETAQAPPLTYKTNHFTAEQKNAAQANAIHQETVIADYFKANPALELGASEIWLRLFGGTYQGKGEAPLTSVRRALTNLQKKGVVRKLQATTIGFYDRQEHLWSARLRLAQTWRPLPGFGARIRCVRPVSDRSNRLPGVLGRR